VKAVETISVVVGHEHALPRDILASACAAGPVALVGCCATSGELIERCTTMRPDVVVLSETIDPDVDAVIATLQGLARSIIMIGGNPSPERLLDLLSRGLQGHLLYDTSPEELAAGIQAVARGVVVINPAVATMLVEHWRWVQTDTGPNGSPATRSLTPREHDVLVAMVEGLSTKAVARRLGVAFKTVENHKIRVFEKLGVRTHAQAVSVAINYGLVADIPRDIGGRVRGGAA
jgi:DNA-binding NarL/FixJ family response regulator